MQRPPERVDYQLLSTYIAPASPLLGLDPSSESTLTQHADDQVAAFPVSPTDSYTDKSLPARPRPVKEPKPRTAMRTTFAAACALSALSVVAVWLTVGSELLLPIRKAPLKPWSLWPIIRTAGNTRTRNGGGYREPSSTARRTTTSPNGPRLPRVERAPSVSLRTYLSKRFDLETDIMWTMATASYVPSTKNWDLKRAELGMSDSVVVLCLDHECLDACEEVGLYALAAYLKDVVKIPPPTSTGSGDNALRKRMGAERGHTMAYLKFRGEQVELLLTGTRYSYGEPDASLRCTKIKRCSTWLKQATSRSSSRYTFLLLRHTNQTTEH